MLGNVYRRFLALPLVAKVVSGILVLAILVFLSPVVAFLAAIVLIVAVIVLVVRALRRRPLRRWGLVALGSLAFLVVFGGISGAVLSNPPQQAPAEKEPLPKGEVAPAGTTAQSTAQEEGVTSRPEPTNSAGSVGKTTTPPASSQPGLEEADGPAPGTSEADATATVARVVDGDTIKISPGIDGIEEVRLIGVDTPETKDPDCAVQPYGSAASQFATTELQGQKVGLEFGRDRTDRYNRLLAYVYQDGEMFNDTLLNQGYAQLYIVPPNDKYEDRFREAQAEAQTAESGIWGLSASEQAELADRGNGIGSAECQQPTASPKVSPTPPPPQQEKQSIPNAPASEAPTPPPALPNGVDCKSGMRNVPVIPGSKGDGDGDGKACEK